MWDHVPYLGLYNATPKEAASFVADQALQFGSEDNSTAVVIPLERGVNIEQQCVPFHTALVET